MHPFNAIAAAAGERFKAKFEMTAGESGIVTGFFRGVIGSMDPTLVELGGAIFNEILTNTSGPDFYFRLNAINIPNTDDTWSQAESIGQYQDGGIVRSIFFARSAMTYTGVVGGDTEWRIGTVLNNRFVNGNTYEMKFT